MAEILTLVVSWLTSLGLIFALLRWDETRLAPEQLERAWPPASFAMAPVYFSVLALPVHFARTRRSFLATCEGLVWAAVVVGLDELVGRGVEAFANRFLPS